ncbi:hypothetical protein [Streptomyces sp. B6B3]|uniref:hypothetical protein n=1 Tax=Streptomyces sp. B6B3 TaxID=3153570 RepID=UPI00325F2812
MSRLIDRSVESAAQAADLQAAAEEQRQQLAATQRTADDLAHALAAADRLQQQANNHLNGRR